MEPRATPERPPAALRHCERCGHPTFKLHCKVRCDNCGHFLDCSDLDIPGPPPAQGWPRP